MDTLHWQHKYKDTRDFLLRLLNKEFLVFLFFLCVSTAFWFPTTLNETYEKEIKVAITITDVPTNIVITEGLPDSVRVTLKDKGFNLVKYLFNDNISPLHLSFALYAKSQNKGSVTPSEIQKILRPRLGESTTILSVKAEHWDFYFCHGNKKKLPVLINGSISPKPNYYISRCTLTPDSVTVLAESAALDTITAVYTDLINLENISESTTRSIALQHIKAAKLEVEQVSLSIITDQLTEVAIRVPVRTVNVPEGISLKTFPAHVEMRVAVGVRNSGIVKPEHFNVVADYNELPTSQDEKLHLKIASQPRGIVKAYIKQPTVDYLIERNK